MSLSDVAGKVDVKHDVPLSEFCTLRIGGGADYLLTPTTMEAAASLLRFLNEAGIRHLVLGKGSNLLFEDAGYRGVILHLGALREIAVDGDTLIAQAGAALSAVAMAAAKAGLSGAEFLYGIPGSVGGGVYMNAGAYGGEIGGILARVLCADDAGNLITLTGAECEPGYRHSRFMREKLTVLCAEFSLARGDGDAIRANMEELMRRRAEKQPLNYPSAGSTFKRYPGRFTAAMIDEAGLKGRTVGGAQVSEKHAGFLINRGGATCKDMKELIDIVRDEVERIHGVRIEREVVYIPTEEGDMVWN